MASRLSPHFDPTPYWGVVEDCLVQFHGLSRQAARQKVKQLRVAIETSPLGVDAEIVYHNEEFDLACSLGGRELDQGDFAEAYDQIAARRYSVVQPRRLAL